MAGRPEAEVVGMPEDLRMYWTHRNSGLKDRRLEGLAFDVFRFGMACRLGEWRSRPGGSVGGGLGEKEGGASSSDSVDGAREGKPEPVRRKPLVVEGVRTGIASKSGGARAASQERRCLLDN